jgi:hypothetical protein
MTKPFNSDVGSRGKIPPKYPDGPHKYYLKDWHVKIAFLFIYPVRPFFLYASGNLAKKH